MNILRDEWQVVTKTLEQWKPKPKCLGSKQPIQKAITANALEWWVAV